VAQKSSVATAAALVLIRTGLGIPSTGLYTHLGGEQQRRLPGGGGVVVRGWSVTLEGQQCLHHGGVALVRRVEQRRLFGAIYMIHVRARFQQHLHTATVCDTQVSSRTRVTQKLTGLSSLYTNPVSVLSPYPNRQFNPLHHLNRQQGLFSGPKDLKTPLKSLISTRVCY
jgi:hypothetical protein